MYGRIPNKGAAPGKAPSKPSKAPPKGKKAKASKHSSS